MEVVRINSINVDPNSSFSVYQTSHLKDKEYTKIKLILKQFIKISSNDKLRGKIFFYQLKTVLRMFCLLKEKDLNSPSEQFKKNLCCFALCCSLAGSSLWKQNKITNKQTKTWRKIDFIWNWTKVSSSYYSFTLKHVYVLEI